MCRRGVGHGLLPGVLPVVFRRWFVVYPWATHAAVHSESAVFAIRGPTVFASAVLAELDDMLFSRLRRRCGRRPTRASMCAAAVAAATALAAAFQLQRTRLRPLAGPYPGNYDEGNGNDSNDNDHYCHDSFGDRTARQWGRRHDRCSKQLGT